MGGHFADGFLALVALVFALLEFSYSNIVVIIAVALILIHALSHALGLCRCGCECNHEPMKNMPKKPMKKK